MNSSRSPVSELRALSDLIKSSVDKMEAALLSRSQTYPSLDVPFSAESDAPRMSPDVLEPGNNIIAAAGQLIAAIRVPALTVTIDVGLVHISSCLRVVIQTHVPEILRAAGSKGAHVNDIAARSGTSIDSHKLARVLRLLSTNHIFKEVTPNVFANNRISSTLDTGKTVAEILKDVEAKHDGSTGFAALTEHYADENLKSAGYLPETLLSPEVAKSGEPNETAFNKAFQTDLAFFSWFDLPDHGYRVRRFSMGMKGAQSMSSPGAILDGFDWKSLAEGSLVVDVGGGIGSQTLELARAFDHLNFIVQDREAVVKEGVKAWDHLFPSAIQSGRVKLQPHNFLDPQPVQRPAVFLMRLIMHDWSDVYCVKILRHLRAAAGPDTYLLVVDNIISYSCHDNTGVHIPGVIPREAPAPLLANKGVANTMPYIADLHMLALLNGAERTAAEWQDLFKEAGWKLIRAFHNQGFEIQSSKLVGVPI